MEKKETEHRYDSPEIRQYEYTLNSFVDMLYSEFGNKFDLIMKPYSSYLHEFIGKTFHVGRNGNMYRMSLFPKLGTVEITYPPLKNSSYEQEDVKEMENILEETLKKDFIASRQLPL